MSASRFTKIEEKVAYLEKLASDLSDIVAQHERSLDELRRRLEGMEHKQTETVETRPQLAIQEPPPHY
jgi:uncharacterized coiled-coil protein SlyX